MPYLSKARNRLPAFGISALLHCALGGLLALEPVWPPKPAEQAQAHRYSVQVLRIDIPKYLRQTPAARSSLSLPGTSSRSVRLGKAGGLEAEIRTYAEKDEQRASAEPRRLREFVMPPPVARQPVAQTLLRPDVPPDITLKQEVPLPNLLLTFDQKLPAKSFVAPPVKQLPKSLPVLLSAAPDLTSQTSPAGAAGINPALTSLPRLPLPVVANGTPARPTSGAVTKQAVAGSGTQVIEDAPAYMNVLSISPNPAIPMEFLVIPPANQIVGGGAGHDDATHSRGDGRTDAIPGKVAGTGTSAGRQTETGKVDGNPSRPSDASHEAAANAVLPGTSTITLPKDGKFGVVVLGSAVTAPYPESEGMLSGRIVYTVYLRVGLKKNWILQYCLPKAAASDARTERARTVLDAPWPYEIVRPEHPVDSDYLLVHGIVTEAGHFQDLAMVFPRDDDRKDLLLQSLRRWVFRPARRDGEPAAIEILLIIPRETE